MEPNESLRQLRPKRDAPKWVETATSPQAEGLWRRLRKELPRPLRRQGWFDALDLERGAVDSLVSGEKSIAEVRGDDDRQRLRVLVSLLADLGRGRYPKANDTLADLWLWVWEESERLANRTAPFADVTLRLLHGEALLASGLYFAGLVGMKSRAKQGRRRLWEEVAEQTDTDGTPSAALLDALPGSLAALIRSGRWAQAGEMRLGKRGELDLFDGLLRVLAAMCSRQSPEADEIISEETVAGIRAGGKLLGWKKSDPAMKHLGELLDPDSGEGTRPRRQAFVQQSDWANLAVFRSEWGAGGDSLVVRHGAGAVVLDWSAQGRLLVAGPWGLEVSVDGHTLSLAGDWEAVSWFEDEEVAYLELQLTDDSEATVCRQVMWSLVDRQLWLADAVSIPDRPESEIEVRGSLPIPAGWNVRPQRPSREIHVSNGVGTPIRLFPLGFPMEATRQAPGTIESQDGALNVRQTGRGGVYVPLLFDWQQSRRTAPADWRTLTVSQDGRRLGVAEAAAARIRLGRQQWLAYRNLNGSAAMRTVIGYHHNQESVIGRFTKQGEIEPLVMVETEDSEE